MKKLLIFIAILFSIYLLFSLSCVILSIKNGLTLSSNLKQLKSKDQYVIGIISPVRRGERQQALMIQKSAEKIGQQSYVYAFNDLDMNLFIPAKYMNYLVIKLLDFYFKTDFHLIMSFHINVPVPEPSIMYISVPMNYIVQLKKLEAFPDIYNYNKFLDINLINSNQGIMEKLLDKKVDSTYAIVGIPANSYKPSDRQKLLMFGSIWGRKTEEFYSALIDLAEKDYMYFLKSPFLFFKFNSNQKFTEEAKTPEDLQNLLNKYGIGLCIHSKFHNESGIPSNRIFEIISSGAIAISDKNPFVVEYFGDNILYFNPNLSKEEIVKQIDNHVMWIKTHPKEADIMARNAHKIIQDKFTTEKFIGNLIGFYKKLSNKK